MPLMEALSIGGKDFKVYSITIIRLTHVRLCDISAL